MSGEAPTGMGFYAQMREKLRQEPVAIAPLHERNFRVFKETLDELNDLSTISGVHTITGQPRETTKEWINGVKALWLVGEKTEGLMKPEHIAGYVNVYVPQHPDAITEWLKSHPRLTYGPEAIVEAYAFIKERPDAANFELGAYKQALGKVFMDSDFQDIKAVTVWETHNDQNVLDPKVTEDMKKLGGWAVGTKRYDASESVDSTCFFITKHAFLDALAGKTKK